MRDATPVPKPEPRKLSRADERRCREKVEREGRCRACGRRPTGHHLDSLNRAHLVGGADREWDPDGIVPLCGSGTSGCHGVLTYRPPNWQYTASELRANLRAEEVAYVVAKKGRDYLDKYYPEAG